MVGRAGLAGVSLLFLATACSGAATKATAARTTPSALPTAVVAQKSVGWCSAQALHPIGIGEPAGLAGETGYYLLARNVGGRPCRVQGFATVAQALLPGGWRAFRFFRGTPLDGDYATKAYVIGVGGSMVVDLVADHSRGYDRSLRWRGVRLRLPHIAGWITWRGSVEPDSGVGLGPAKQAVG